MSSEDPSFGGMTSPKRELEEHEEEEEEEEEDHEEIKEEQEGESEDEEEAEPKGPAKLKQLLFSILYGYDAVPIRLKILLDRALSVLSEEERRHLLEEAGWRIEDFERGYRLEDSNGTALNSWLVADVAQSQTMEKFRDVPVCVPLIDSLRAGIHLFANPSLPGLMRSSPAWSLFPFPPTLPHALFPTVPPAAMSESVSEAQSHGDDASDETNEEKKKLAFQAKNANKRRVTCERCGKTFCDKGALKIHTSAVHLKEMHRCTVPGCNKEFSSRRSRNRHSSNTNPKLHVGDGSGPREPGQVFPSDFLNGSHTDTGGASPDSSSPSTPSPEEAVGEALNGRKRKGVPSRLEPGARRSRGDDEALDLSKGLNNTEMAAKLGGVLSALPGNFAGVHQLLALNALLQQQPLNPMLLNLMAASRRSS